MGNLEKEDVIKMRDSTKLNLGCGTDIRPDCVNLDVAALDGVDIVHDLESFPYPFEDNAFEEIVAINVLEHLPDTLKALEELWRICRHGAKVIIRVPYWNSISSITDPTHVRSFSEHTFDFFDPTKARCQKRPYYSKARLQIQKEYFYVLLPKWGYVKVYNSLIKRLLSMLAYFMCNIISLLEYELTVIK